jgi:hypothetical protein
LGQIFLARLVIGAGSVIYALQRRMGDARRQLLDAAKG